MVRYCSRKMHCHPKFRLYLSTTSYPVHVAPSLAALVSLTDFTPKHQSLCSTLLQVCVGVCVVWCGVYSVVCVCVDACVCAMCL